MREESYCKKEARFFREYTRLWQTKESDYPLSKQDWFYEQIAILSQGFEDSEPDSKPIGDTSKKWGCFANYIKTLRKDCEKMQDLFDVQVMKTIHFMDVMLDEEWCKDGKYHKIPEVKGE